jgi:hypothetical protein
MKHAPGKGKFSSDSGQDLRLPILGGTKFPTNDSKKSSMQNLNASQAVSQARPGGDLPGPSIQDVTPKISPSTAGSLPKIGHDMRDDPLIQYLRKQAQPVETNENEVPPEKIMEPEITSQQPQPATEDVKRGLDAYHACLENKFTDRKGIRQKYTDKDELYSIDADLVDKFIEKTR